MAKAKYADLPQYVGFAETEAAANGGVISQIPSSLTTRDRVGILIHSVEFLPESYKTCAGIGTIFAATGDGLTMGLTQLWNAGAVPDFNDPGVIEYMVKFRNDITAVGVIMAEGPWKIKYDTPKLAHPAALYWFFQGVNQPAAIAMNIRIEYSYRDLSAEEYQDIIQTIVLQNSL